MPKLTKRAIEAEQLGAARRDIWDSDLRGFGLRIEASGTKTSCDSGRKCIRGPFTGHVG